MMLSEKMGIKTMRLIFTLLITAFFTGGCWNWREMNQLAIVSGTGIDLADSPDRIVMTVQIVKPGSVKGGNSSGGGGESGGGGGQEKPVWITQSTGNTISEALRNFVFQSNRQLYFSHNLILVISEDAAKQGVRQYIDFFLRSHEPRPTTWILIADGKAGDILRVPGHLEKISAMEIGRLVANQSFNSETASTNLADFTNRLISKTTAPVASRIQIIGPEGDRKFRVIGAAVFKHEKMVGEFDKTETRGLLWVLNKVRQGVIVVNAPQNAGKVSLEISKGTCKLKPMLQNGHLRIKVEINAQVIIGNQTDSVDLSQPKILKSLSRRTSELIKREVRAALHKARQLNTDVFGFGDAFHRSYPKEWKTLEPDWDQIFPTIKVDFRVKTDIPNLGLIVKPIIPEQKK